MTPNTFQLAIPTGLNRLGKHIYGGTADPVDVAKRRKANKRAKAQRKANR